MYIQHKENEFTESDNLKILKDYGRKSKDMGA